MENKPEMPKDVVMLSLHETQAACEEQAVMRRRWQVDLIQRAVTSFDWSSKTRPTYMLRRQAFSCIPAWDRPRARCGARRGRPDVETILIVDDEWEVAAVARDMLEAKGYTTLETDDPMSALRIAETETQPIHLLLTDVVMPVMDGGELARQIRSIRPAIRVLFMSAFTTEIAETYGIQIDPGEPFIVKPFSMEQLTSKVRVVLDRRSPFGKRPAP